jgi:type II secretory pathway pseudopilin PulG
MMVVIVLIGLASAVVIQSVRVARRDRQLAALARLMEDYRRAVDRMQWAERMHKKGYVSKAQLDVENASFRRELMSVSSIFVND